MRRSASFLIPTAIISAYYAFWVAAVIVLIGRYPALRNILPVGGLSEITTTSAHSFEPIYTMAEDTVLAPNGPLRLVFACIGSAILIVPVSWVYFITSRTREVDQSFVQTIVLMPVVVTGIAMIVMNSLALAFSLAGVVAAVRFRFSLRDPAHAMYIFCAIGIGLGSGIGSLGIAAVISGAFVFGNLIIWKFEYGKTLSGPFFSMLTRRDRNEEDQQ